LSKTNDIPISAGLATAVTMIEPIKKKFPLVSYADLFQMASATAIEVVCLFSSHPLQTRAY
jgi:catalase (peroxidase I)